MTLEELIYTRLVQEKELAESLAKYEGVPAVFLQKAPDDKAQGWGVSQYPRADYLVDMTADPERHSSGMVSVNVYSDDTGKPPEELAPLVRIALCDVVMQADDGAYCITWARTELFEMNDSQNPNTLVNGCSLTFLLIAFPCLLYTSDAADDDSPDTRTPRAGGPPGHPCEPTTAGGMEQLDTVSIRHSGQTGRNYPPGRCTAAF